MKDFKYLVTTLINNVINPLSYLLVGLGIAYFLAGVLKYVRHSDSEEDRAEGKKMMTYGIVALFVMISVWGLVRVVQGTLPLNNDALEVPRLTN